MIWTNGFAPLLTQFSRPAAFLPAADLLVSGSDVVLTLDLPGLTSDDVSIEMQGTQMTVRGVRRRPELQEGTTYACAQRPFGGFEHRIELPEGVDPESISASMEHGVLSLIVPKPEPAKPRRIAVETKEVDRELEPAAA